MDVEKYQFLLILLNQCGDFFISLYSHSVRLSAQRVPRAFVI